MMLLLVTLAAGGDFDAIVGGVGERPHAASCAQVDAWAAANAAEPRARRGRVWCARLLAADGAVDEALRRLEAVLAQPELDEPRTVALVTTADLHLQRGEYQLARAQYLEVARSPLELWRTTAAHALVEVDRAQRVWWQAALGGALLALAVGWRGWRVGRELWPPPAELWVLLPLLGLLVVAALGGPGGAVRAVGALALGAAALAWVDGAWLRAHPPSGRRRWSEALQGGAHGLLLLDVVLVGSGVWRPLWQSLTEGFW